jgi:hypothetical protein
MRNAVDDSAVYAVLKDLCMTSAVALSLGYKSETEGPLIMLDYTRNEYSFVDGN